MASQVDELLAKGTAQLADEAYADALVTLTEALAREPAHAEALVRRSAVHLKLGAPLDALADANAALAAHPALPNALFRKASALFELSEFEAAMEVFCQGEKAEPASSRWSLWIRKCRAELEADGKPVPPLAAAAATSVAAAAAPPTAAAAAPAASAAPKKVRHEWYQTDTHVVITVFCKGLTKDTLTYVLSPSSAALTVKLDTASDWQLDLDPLAGEIVPADSRLDILSTKAELWLKKRFAARWPTLEAQAGAVPPAVVAATAAVAAPTAAPTSGGVPPPYSSKRRLQDWDKFVAEQKDLDDDDPLNKVFKDIYGNGSEEQRRAMMKSYVESGGTVLSTNWEDVGKKKVEVSPPDGMVAKAWKDDTVVARPEDRKGKY